MLPARMAYNAWTPERIERLRVLVGRGDDIGSIMADALLAPSSVQSLRNMCTRLRLPLRDPRQATSACTLRLAPAQRAMLERLARQRGVRASALAQRIISVTLDQQLVDAVLDDADTRRSSPAAKAKPESGTRRSRQHRADSQAIDREAAEIARMVAAGGNVLDAMQKIAKRAV
jgi:hypothetical protein